MTQRAYTVCGVRGYYVYGFRMYEVPFGDHGNVVEGTADIISVEIGVANGHLRFLTQPPARAPLLCADTFH